MMYDGAARRTLVVSSDGVTLDLEINENVDFMQMPYPFMGTHGHTN